jgi:hypothetical protein
VKVSDVPAVPVAGPVIETASANGEIATVVDALAVFALPSVAVTLMVYVPFTLYVVLKALPLPEAGLPPVAVQANV